MQAHTSTRSIPASDLSPQHILPALPYSYSALEACIDARTMTLHHDKHHAGYVEKLNELLLPHAELQTRSARWLLLNSEVLPEGIRDGVLHNAGGHFNHSLLWQAMSPSGGGEPTGSLCASINTTFGSVQAFRSRFEEAGSTLFGSGWVWLVAEPSKGTSVPRLEIVTTSGHDNPVQQGRHPLLVNDVWEHAYYLRYENKRPAYLKSWWSIVDWNNALHRLENFDDTTELEPADGLLRRPS